MVSLSDPLLWLGILVLILLLGPSKLPQLARAAGEAVREWKKAFEEGSRPQPTPTTQYPQTSSPQTIPQQATETIDYSHPIVVAAIKEGIDVRGKTLDQIAEELAKKLRERGSRQSI
ncbi:MAG: twin-arginine translocase TatA/TatE family subunit [Sulfolobales archaeon]